MSFKFFQPYYLLLLLVLPLVVVVVVMMMTMMGNSFTGFVDPSCYNSLTAVSAIGF